MESIKDFHKKKKEIEEIKKTRETIKNSEKIIAIFVDGHIRKH